MAGLSGSVPYGVAGSVSVTAACGALVVAAGACAAGVAAPAIGANATATPIAAAATHGAAWLMIVISVSCRSGAGSERGVQLTVGGVGFVMVGDVVAEHIRAVRIGAEGHERIGACGGGGHGVRRRGGGAGDGRENQRATDCCCGHPRCEVLDSVLHDVLLLAL